MIPRLGLVAVICLVLWVAFKQPRRSELLLLLPFVVTSNLFGFVRVGTFDLHGLIREGDVVFILLLVLMYFFMGKTKNVRGDTEFHATYWKIATAFTAFLIAELVLSIAEYGKVWESFKVFSQFFRYSSVFIFFYMFERLDPDQVQDLLLFVEDLTLALCALYIINFGFGVQVFGVQTFKTFLFGGQDLFRNYYAIPSFSIFTLSMLLLRPKFTPKSAIGIGVIILTLLLSYTRNFVFSSLFVLMATSMIGFFYYGMKIRRLAFVGVTVLLFGVITLGVFANQLRFFMSRVNEVQQYGGIESSPNLVVRERIILSRVELVLHSNPVTGVGFLGDKASPTFYPNVFVRHSWDKPGQLLIGDQSWGNVIVSIGFGGAAILLLLFAYPIYHITRNKSFRDQSVIVYAALLALFIEFFVAAFFEPNLLDSVFKICFYFALIDYCVTFQTNRSLGSGDSTSMYFATGE